MSQRRSVFGLTIDEQDNTVYVFGGYDGSSSLKECEKYSSILN